LLKSQLESQHSHFETDFEFGAPDGHAKPEIGGELAPPPIYLLRIAGRKPNVSMYAS
jgi:hypothetical protein